MPLWALLGGCFESRRSEWERDGGLGPLNAQRTPQSFCVKENAEKCQQQELVGNAVWLLCWKEHLAIPRSEAAEQSRMPARALNFLPRSPKIHVPSPASRSISRITQHLTIKAFWTRRKLVLSHTFARTDMTYVRQNATLRQSWMCPALDLWPHTPNVFQLTAMLSGQNDPT